MTWFRIFQWCLTVGLTAVAITGLRVEHLLFVVPAAMLVAAVAHDVAAGFAEDKQHAQQIRL